MAPEYDHNYGGESPLPLNLGLTWWADLFGNAKGLWSRDKQYFPAKLGILRALGKVSDPRVLWSTIALNYYRIPVRGEVKSEFIPEELYAGMTKEKDFVRQFASHDLRRSFDATLVEADLGSEKSAQGKFEAWYKRNEAALFEDAGLRSLKVMLEDRATGGANHLLTLLSAQLDKLSKAPRFNREKILQETRLREVDRLEKLMQWPYMFPPPETRDTRRENLQLFKKNLESATTRREDNQDVLLTEKEIAPVNQALREFLNVYQGDITFPSGNQSINEAFIQQQYQAWIRKQVGRWRAADTGDAQTPSLWAHLGLTSAGLVEMLLNSIVDSITEEQREEMAEWLRNDVGVGHNGPAGSFQYVDCTSFLAVKMSNYLVGSHAIYPDSTKPPSYLAVIEPFLKEQLPELLNAPGRTLVQVAIPGTKELEQLCDEFKIERPAGTAD
jgi:hypothetical protein